VALLNSPDGLDSFKASDVGITGFTFPQALTDEIAASNSVTTREIGKNTYDSTTVMTNIARYEWTWKSGSTPVNLRFNVRRNWVASQITSFATAPARRSLLDFFRAKLNGNTLECERGENRMIRMGAPIKDACNCPDNCGKNEAACDNMECPAGEVGANNVCHIAAIGLDKDVCDDGGSSNRTGAIVGGVLGGFFGLLLLAALAYFCCLKKTPVAQPYQPPEENRSGNYEGRPVAPVPEKVLAPVYLPQPYPAHPQQEAPPPSPGPRFPGVGQPPGQPTRD
jgi:hypothetical protein